MALSSTVKAARAGLQNKLRSWLGAGHGKTSGASPNAAGGVGSMRYVCGTIEAQTRQLGDCAFLLGDYASALSAYRQAAGEFKGDRAWWHYAAALEMSALCLYMTDGGWREMDESAEKAAATYLKLSSAAGDRSARHATRSVLLQMDLLAQAPAKKREQACRDVAQALVDQSTQESSLAAALLLEQAALCFRTKGSLPMQRKYAFYLILAGYRYISCSQRRHAVRTYATALRVYSGKGWAHIEDHVHFTLGRNCAQLSHIELGLAYFLRLLRHSRQPAERQQTFMKELGSILRAHPEHSRLPALPLPRFSCKSIRVLLNDHNQPSGTQAAGLLSALHPLWKPLTAPLLPASEAATGNWLTGMSASASASAPAAPCVVGEWVFVELDVENPMHVQLSLSHLQLDCALERSEGGGGEAGGGEAGGGAGAGGASAGSEGAAPGSDDLETDVQELVLTKGGRALVRLGVRAHRVGHLTISGVRWTLNGAAHGTFALELHGRRLNKTKAQRMGKVYAFDQSLAMRVVQPMPLLQARIDGLPQSMLLGELVRTTLVLSNVGRTPLCEAKLRLSQPAFCVLVDADAPPDGMMAGEAAAAAAKGTGIRGSSGIAVGPGGSVTERPVLSAEAPPGPMLSAAEKMAAERAARQQGAGGGGAHGVPPDYSLVSLPLPDGKLAPGGTLELPLWVRAAALGAHTLHFVFAYSPSVPSPHLQRRLCPISARVRVHPSLAIQHTIRPLVRGDSTARGGVAATPPAEYALTLHVQNVAASRRMRVSQLSCVSGGWSAAPLTSRASLPAPLQPTEANAIHLRLVRHSDGISSSADAPTPSASTTTAMRHCEIACIAPGAPGAAPIDSRKAPHLECLLRTAAPPVTEAGDEMPAPTAFGKPKRARNLTPSQIAASTGLSLVVHWADADGAATGAVHVSSMLPQPPLAGLTVPAAPAPAPVAPPAPLAAAGAPSDTAVVPITPEKAEILARALRVSVECAAKITHRFDSSAVCQVPIKVVVQNCLPQSSLAFTLHLASDPVGAPAGGATPQGEGSSLPLANERLPSGECLWLGATRHAERWLEPSASVTLPLRVAVTAPGTYSLDGLRLAVNAWKAQSDQPEQRTAAAVVCPPPPPRTVQVVEAPPGKR